MTCVLSMTPLYANPCSSYTEDGTDIQNKTCERFDFNWINTQNTHAGLTESHRCSTPCRIEASTGSSLLCMREVSNGLSGTVKHELLNVHNDTIYETELKSADSARDLEKPVSTNGEQGVGNLFEMCNQTGAEPNHVSSRSAGIKRKVEMTEFEEVYIPSKRVSPFLNTPKERKDERKKILKLSIKKLKQLDDPEAFLRRTVLVNNTVKRLQSELREEKLRYKKFESNKKKSFNGYGVLNNSCLSNSYLFDDPFLSGVHEKITDDMTDTLMNNVFHDKPSDRTFDSEPEGSLTDKTPPAETEAKLGDRLLLSNSGSQSRTESCDMDICDTDLKVESSLLTSLEVSGDSDSSNPSSCERNTHGIVSCKDSSHQTCSDKRTNAQEIPVDTCDISTCGELVRASRCNKNNNEENSKSICIDNREATQYSEYKTQYSEYKTECIRNACEVECVYHDQNMECDRLHSTNLDFEKSTDVQIHSTDTFQRRLHTDKDNSVITSKSAINGLEIVSENTYGLDLLDLDQKLDQKTLSQSFNTFLSAFDISHAIPISLSFKES